MELVSNYHMTHPKMPINNTQSEDIGPQFASIFLQQFTSCMFSSQESEIDPMWQHMFSDIVAKALSYTDLAKPISNPVQQNLIDLQQSQGKKHV